MFNPRKVKAVTEGLCGHISAINKTLDESLRAFSERGYAVDQM
jgi:transposase-like protein